MFLEVSIFASRKFVRFSHFLNSLKFFCCHSVDNSFHFNTYQPDVEPLCSNTAFCNHLMFLCVPPGFRPISLPFYLHSKSRRNHEQLSFYTKFLVDSRLKNRNHIWLAICLLYVNFSLTASKSEFILVNRNSMLKMELRREHSNNVYDIFNQFLKKVKTVSR